MAGGINYLACPHHHPDSKVMEYRQMKATQIAAALIREGVVIFSPLSHCQNMLNLPWSWEFWEHQDRPFVEMSERLLVLCLPGWKQSKGVQKEIELAKMMSIPIMYLNKEGVPCSFEWEDTLELLDRASVDGTHSILRRS
jgi:hypothetical protein